MRGPVGELISNRGWAWARETNHDRGVLKVLGVWAGRVTLIGRLKERMDIGTGEPKSTDSCPGDPNFLTLLCQMKPGAFQLDPWVD